MIPARALFNYLFSFCPIDLHCEPFNYTIHHLLNMKNGVKHMLIRPCRKAFCPLNQANVHGAFMYVGMYVCCFSCHQFYIILSKPADVQRLWRQVPWIHFNALLAEAFVCFAFVLGHNETNLIGRACLILIQYQQSRRTDEWKSSQIIEVN